MSQVRKWASYEHAALVRMARAGARSEDIGAAVGRTGNAVRQRARRVGIALRPCPGQADAVRRAVLLDFLMEHPGASLAAAGRVLGRTKQAVGKMARALAAEGLLCRGAGGPGCRYRVTAKWDDGRKARRGVAS
jgi:hypothetical protein